MSANPSILLLGAAGAGKTALLAALGQSVEDWQRSAAFTDCDGRLAQEYIAGARSLQGGDSLAQSIRAADAIVLTLAPAKPKQFEQDVDQLKWFLHAFERERGKHSEIAGMPVFLVLTKADLLGKPGDTAGVWMQRVEESKEELGRRFDGFLDQAGASPFGQVDLHVWATAIKRPELNDRRGRSQEPFGVAEFFQQVVPSARAYQQARGRAQRRLRRALVVLSVLIAVMALVGAGMYLLRPSAAVAALENEARATVTAPAADRLREPLADRFKELTAIQENPVYPQLPAHLRREVRQAAQELAAYQAIAKKADGLKRVRFFRKDADISAYTRVLDTIVVPKEYAASWAPTRLAKRLAQYHAELTALGAALTAERTWLVAQQAIGDKLLRMAIPEAGTPEREAWIHSADVFLRSKDLTKPVPHVTNMKLKDLYEFPSLRGPRQDYEQTRARVAKIRGGLGNS